MEITMDSNKFWYVVVACITLISMTAMLEDSRYRLERLNVISTANPQSICFSEATTNEQFEICKSMTPQ
jgi:hypothetical protein